jgi:hypothetical protein
VIQIGEVDLSEVNLVEIVDANGKVGYRANELSAIGINVSFLKTGIYILKTTQTDGQQNTHKLLIAR